MEQDLFAQLNDTDQKHGNDYYKKVLENRKRPKPQEAPLRIPRHQQMWLKQQ